MLKKISILTLILALVLSGCAGKPNLTAKETLVKIMEKEVELNEIGASMDVLMNVDFDEEKLGQDPEAGAMLGMFKDLKMKLNFTALDIKSDFKIGFDGSVDLNGLNVNVDGYIDKDMAAVNYPMMGKYITVDFKELIKMANESGEANISEDIIERVVKDFNTVLMPKIIAYTTESLAEEDVKFVEDYAFMVNGEEVKEKAIVYTIAPDKMMDFSMDFYKKLAYDEEVYNMLKAYNIPDFPADFETFKSEFDKAFAEIDKEEAQTEIQEMFKDMNYDIAMAYNDDYTPKYAKMKMNMTIDTQEEEVGKIGYKYDVDVVYNYKDLKVEKPELTEENSMDFMMLIQGMLMTP